MYIDTISYTYRDTKKKFEILYLIINSTIIYRFDVQIK